MKHFSKKTLLYFFMLASFCCLAACGGDDDDPVTGNNTTVNPVTPAPTQKKVTLNVGVKSMYSNMSIAEDVAKKLDDKSSLVGIYTYVYDVDGNLVQEKFSTTESLSSISQVFELNDGKYNFLTIETLVDVENNNQPEKWTIDQKEKLSTVKLIPKSELLTRYDLIGVYSSIFDVKKDRNETINPKPKGSIVNVTYHYFERSPYDYVGLVSGKTLESYSLDPSLKLTERYKYKTADQGYVCTKAMMTTKLAGQGYYSVSYVLEDVMDWKFAYGKSIDGGVNWAWNNANVGSTYLSDGSEYMFGYAYMGEYSAPEHFVGNKSEWQSWYKALRYKGGELTLNNPCVNWGTTVATVHSFMTGFQQILGTSTKAVKGTGTTYYQTAYQGNGAAERLYLYDFNQETRDLTASIVYYNSSSVGEDILIPALKKKFTYIGVEEDMYMFISADRKTAVMAMEDDGLWSVLYADYNALSSAKNTAQILSAKANAILKAAKGKVKTSSAYSKMIIADDGMYYKKR